MMLTIRFRFAQATSLRHVIKECMYIRFKFKLRIEEEEEEIMNKTQTKHQ